MKNIKVLILSLFLAQGVLALNFEAGSSGGSGGYPFSDNPPSDFLRINSIRLCGAQLVDSIEVTYVDSSAKGNIYSYGKHGRDGGSCSTLHFWAGEYITSASGRYGSKVDSLIITTNFGRTIRKGGSGGPATFEYKGDDQFMISGFKGRSGSLVDAIGVIYTKMY